jgi:hypothetical protein
VFAADAPTSEQIGKQIDGAAAFLEESKDTFGVDDAVLFSIIAESGADLSDYDDAFINDVKANLQANDGRIVSTYGESLETYAAVIVSLLELGEDPEDFNGYDIVKVFFAMDPTVEPYSLNYYRIITTAAYYYTEEDTSFIEAVCDTYIANHYVEGAGVSYYNEYSCDSLAYFIVALSNAYYLTDKYDQILEDSIMLLDTYKTDGGYFYNSVYGTEPNADSTALALLAHSSYMTDAEFLDETDSYYDNLNSIYADLCSFEVSTGVFAYTKDGEANSYATQEALMALSSYYTDVVFKEYLDSLGDDNDNNNDDNVATETTKKSNKTEQKETTTNEDTTKKSPNTGANPTAISAVFALCAAAGAVVVLKKKEK